MPNCPDAEISRYGLLYSFQRKLENSTNVDRKRTGAPKAITAKTFDPWEEIHWRISSLKFTAELNLSQEETMSIWIWKIDLGELDSESTSSLKQTFKEAELAEKTTLYKKA